MAGTHKPDPSCEADQENEYCQQKYSGTLQGTHGSLLSELFWRLGIADVFHIRAPISLAVLHHVRNAGSLIIRSLITASSFLNAKSSAVKDCPSVP
jgi:hypothetical protein